jgi:putative nucleotidyltransferase with HDIG domain
MSTFLSRAEAWTLLTEWVASTSLRRHCLAVEASMRAVAAERGADVELWGVAGLLHDMDYERFPDPETGHPRPAIAELERRDADPAIIHAITVHATYLGVAPESDLDRSLLAVDELSGFVVAVAQVRPEGINGMTPKSVKKKLKTPAFAAAVSREDVARGPELLGMEIDELIRLVIGALAGAAEELELHGAAAA